MSSFHRPSHHQNCTYRFNNGKIWEGKGKRELTISGGSTSRTSLKMPLLSCPSPSPKAPLKCPVFKHWEGIGKDKGKEEGSVFLLRYRTYSAGSSSLLSFFLPPLSAPKCFVFYAVGRLREKKRTL